MIRRAFSLIELLAVLAIMAIVFGMFSYNYAKGDGRLQSVLAAADELAATCRRARALAMERRATHAVVFHLQNQPGSSGRVLNNRSGGHWYRILGPATDADRSQTVDDLNPMVNDWGYPHTLVESQQYLARNWVDEVHALPAGKVRFLALSDMDYGNGGQYGDRRQPSAQPSYPRPWFGWYDAAGQRLYPWGGYDPAIAGSGFFYAGALNGQTMDSWPIASRIDAAPVGCINQSERKLDMWLPTRSFHLASAPYETVAPDALQSDLLYAKDSPRPLLNADWRDACIVFMADGSVQAGQWMWVRHTMSLGDSGRKDHAAGPYLRGVAERCNGRYVPSYGLMDLHLDAEAGHFDQSTGGVFATLAPDSPDDNDSFPSARAALDSMMPMVRVFVSLFGEVQVIAVSRIPKLNGMAPFPPNAAWCQTTGNWARYFPRDRMLDGSAGPNGWGTWTGNPVGAPITSWVTPDILANRQFWME